MKRIVGVFSTRDVRYALAGGVAVSMYASPRATEDIDFLVAADDLEAVISLLAGLGFRVTGAAMDLAGGRLRMQRLLKFEGTQLLPVDLIVPHDAALARLVDECALVDWGGERIAIVTVDGLRTLKRLRGSAQDLADLEALGSEP